MTLPARSRYEPAEQPWQKGEFADGARQASAMRSRSRHQHRSQVGFPLRLWHVKSARAAVWTLKLESIRSRGIDMGIRHAAVASTSWEVTAISKTHTAPRALQLLLRPTSRGAGSDSTGVGGQIVGGGADGGGSDSAAITSKHMNSTLRNRGKKKASEEDPDERESRAAQPRGGGAGQHLKDWPRAAKPNGGGQ